MSNKTVTVRGKQILYDFDLLDMDEQSTTKPTRTVRDHLTYRYSVDLVGVLPSTAVVKDVRCDSGSSVEYIASNTGYTEGGFSSLLTPEGNYFSEINKTGFQNYLEQYGLTTVYYRIGYELWSNDWQWHESRSGGWWSIAKSITAYFRPWFEITYVDGGIEKKIRFTAENGNTGVKSWLPASTYASVKTPDGLKWYECEVYACVGGRQWVDIPRATAEEQPRTDRYEVVGNDVPRKLLEGYCGNSANTWNRVRGSYLYGCLTLHDVPAGEYKVRFSCSYNVILSRVNHDGTWEELQTQYTPGTYDYTVTTTTTGFVGFTFRFNNSTQRETFEIALEEGTGEISWVQCGQEVS